ncbi:small heat shock protein [Suillus cothurnatus]|nr:small heat shock protein [Suillus cothurnatus]
MFRFTAKFFPRFVESVTAPRIFSLRPSILTRRRDQVFPRMDLLENAETKTVTATFELPGMKQQDVNIEVNGNCLTISGESKRSENQDKGGYTVQERSYGKFSRTLQIPQGIKAEDVHARMKNGLLTVCYPKAKQGQQPHRVTIN